MTSKIDDEELMELFEEELSTNGIASCSTDDGVVLAVTSDTLRQLLEAAENNSEGRVIIFIQDSVKDTGDTIQRSSSKLLN